MDTAAKLKPSAAHRAISWLFFVFFVALLGFGIVVYAQSSTHISGLAMAVIGILGIAALATSLRLARGRALGNRRPVYAGGRAGAWNAGADGIHQHDQWFHNQRI
jgi:amino acid transporter